MKSITLHRPWSSFVAFGLKSIETRRHDRFRGLVGETVAIHGGQKRVFVPFSYIERQFQVPSARMNEALDHAIAYSGVIVCLADVIAHRRLTDADAKAALCPADGLYGLILDNVRRFREPIPARGQQGIWEWEPPENWRGLVTD